MVALSRLRPLTFFGRVPKGATNVDICKALVQRFWQSELKSVQDFDAGRFEVTFRTKAAVDRFSADPALKLEVFGKVLGISEECVPGFASVGTGNRRIWMVMARPVPNIPRVGDRVAQCEYEGVARLCRSCNLEGHHAVASEMPKCARCEQFGHESCEAACVRCGGDHADSSCPVRTYSSVTSSSEQQPSAPGQEEALPTVATDNGNSQGSLSEGDTAGGDVDSSASEAPTSLSTAATSGGGSGEEVAAAVPAAAAGLSGEPEPLASTSTEAAFIEVPRKKRKKKRSKHSGSAARKAAAQRTSSDSEGGGSHGSEHGLHKSKRTAVLASDAESEMDDSSEGEENSPCKFCKGFDCDCSVMSGNSYGSTAAGSPVVETLA
ncbi:hypothetical protein HPB49_023566 [Dermacentor silvarum]|uniref:Uncharacterized protein n=1 Tax=Dermacentor silvarum TaxID=543639 RepID=A0ACB8E4A2_DERSI|nr:hypothetical protein HPB49_023566 [Dermacentor silvarum]